MQVSGVPSPTEWHVEGVTPHGMFMEWDRRYTDDELLALMSALVNREPWGAAQVKLTRVVPA